MGIVRPGAVSATIGTSGVVFAATDRPALDKRGRVHTFCHAVPGRWHVMGVTQAAGLSLRWFRDRFGAGEAAQEQALEKRDPYELLSEEAASAPPGSDGVLWAPYLMGERTPHLDHVVRAILEGVAFSLRDTLTIFAEMDVPVETIRLGGGGARSPLWRQIQADVYGRAIEILAAEEGAAYGAALLAGVGSGLWQSVDEACTQAVRVAQSVEPDAGRAALMNKSYIGYRALYPALRSISEAAGESA
jgi:xylulokinase